MEWDAVLIEVFVVVVVVVVVVVDDDDDEPYKVNLVASWLVYVMSGGGIWYCFCRRRRTRQDTGSLYGIL